jgi:hypothetical protein
MATSLVVLIGAGQRWLSIEDFLAKSTRSATA